ncbi:MAG: hypothetical protein H0U27_03640, partial [Nitrosopumilus sp.]|nr:hypothetical protein [Nitrosopumilus sp.]
MNKQILFLLILGFGLNQLNAQNYLPIWDKAYGGIYIDGWIVRGIEILQIPNGGGFILAGESSSGSSGNRNDSICETIPDLWFVRIDSTGNIIWDRALSGGGAGENKFSNLIFLNDSLFAFSSNSSCDSGCEKSDSSRGNADYWIGVMDIWGNLLWEKT